MPNNKPTLFQRLFQRNRLVENPLTRAGNPWSILDSVDRNPGTDIDGDFGYPQLLEFEQFRNMYNRNALANAAINLTVQKCYQSYPVLTHTDEGVDETPQEELIRKHFKRIRFWQHFIECDRRGQVGGFAGLILRIADGKRFNEPVDGGLAGAGVEAIVEVIPAWRGQLSVARWISDTEDVNYGKPEAYQFTEANLYDDNDNIKMQPRAFEVHPDRILIFSQDGTIHADSVLLPGYNALLDVEKILGAGAAGFWKNARGAPFFEVDPALQTQEMQRGVGARSSDDFNTLMSSRMKSWLKGWSNWLMIKGVKPHFPNVALPSPEHYFKNSAQFFASSLSIPYRVLVGNETGERASTEDAREWAQTCMSRRQEVIIPIIEQLIFRLQEWGAIDNGDWRIEWVDLTDATAEEKRTTAEKMVAMNSQMVNATGELVFTSEEVREVMGFEPLSDEDKIVDRMEDDSELQEQATGGDNRV